MNENHFIKIARKSQFHFEEFVVKKDSVPIKDETGKTLFYTNPVKFHFFRTIINVNEKQNTKKSVLIKKPIVTDHVYFDFERSDDTKIKQTVFFWDKVSVNLTKEISQREFRQICKNGITITSKQYNDFINEQIRLNKQKLIEERKQELEKDFKNDEEVYN